ncbi:citrate synthase [Gammaproteobacteria bacterium]|nr:citrate synthase [Gammaproteobacteria bacterium]
MTDSSTHLYSPGLVGIIATESSVSNINGKKGILSYRGYSIEELAKKSTFEEASYLLLFGQLPTKTELEEFTAKVSEHRKLPNDLIKILKSLPKETKPMDVLQMAVSSLGTFYNLEVSPEKVKGKKYNKDYFMNTSAALIGSLGSVVAAWHRIRNDKEPITSNQDSTYAENFLLMLGAENITPLMTRIMDATLVLHGEHTINASTFTAMVTSSTLANASQVVASAIGSLSGPLHGGANEKVVSMLSKIDSKDDIRPWLDDTLKAKNVVWGMGHREYSVKDPRANILTEMVQELFNERDGGVTDIFEKAIELEKACEDKLAHKGVYPNVDFYSGILYKEMGIPTDIFTPIFAMSRVSGWLAHWIEQIQDNKIFRPTQNYVGSVDRDYTNISDR